MLMDISGNEVRSVSYNAVTRELKVIYANGGVKRYCDVPMEIYEKIRNNGNLISDAINETLDANYKSSMLL